MTNPATPPSNDIDNDPDDDTPPAATPEQAREALDSGRADPGAAPEGKDETFLEGYGRAIGNIVLGSLPDPGPRDGVAGGPDATATDDK